MDSFLELFQLFAGNVFLYVFALLFSISAVIFLHEMGHYLTARFFGVRVEKFSIGFGKEIWGRTDRHGTRWSLARWPLGGYIKIYGDLNPAKPEIWDAEKEIVRPLHAAERKVAFCLKPVWQRALIIAAGPAVNLLLAFVIFFALFVTRGQGSTPPVVTALAHGTSGYEAGFQLGDQFLSIDGKPVVRFEDIWDETYYNAGKIFNFRVLRGDSEVEIKAAPRPIEYQDDKGIDRAHGRLGATYIGAVDLKDIVSIDGVDVADKPEKARALLLQRMGREVAVGMKAVDDEPEVFSLRGLPEFNAPLSDPEHESHHLFFSKSTDQRLYIRFSPVEAAVQAVKQIQKMMLEAFRMIEVIIKGRGQEDSIGGVMTMGDAAGKAIEHGFYTFLAFIAVLSIQIALINLLPVPLLDGGHLVFLAYEALFRRPLPERVQAYAFALGLAFLIGIMILANVSDIIQFAR